MSVKILDIADATVTALNAATLTQDFTAVRAYVPKFDTLTSTTVQVKVVPKADAREPGGHTEDAATLLIDIGVMKKLQLSIAEEVTEIDGLMALCEELRHVVNRQRLAGVEDSICVGVTQDPVYSVEEIDNSRIFLTVLTTTWQTETAV